MGWLARLRGATKAAQTITAAASAPRPAVRLIKPKAPTRTGPPASPISRPGLGRSHGLPQLSRWRGRGQAGEAGRGGGGNAPPPWHPPPHPPPHPRDNHQKPPPP